MEQFFREYQFTIAALGAFGTITAVVVAMAIALWGKRLGSWLVKPELQLRLPSPTGELIQQNVPAGAGVRSIDSRYFHLRVENRHRYFAPAHDVQVIVMAVEEIGRDGTARLIQAAPVVLTWRFPEINALTTRTIGPPAEADIMYVNGDNVAQFLAYIMPNNFPGRHVKPFELRITAIARSIEVDSKPIRLLINWDGQFDAHESKIGYHLRILQEAMAV